MIFYKNVMKLFYVFLVPAKMVILSAKQDQTAIVIVVILNGPNGVIAQWPVEVVSRQGAGVISLNFRQICIAHIIETKLHLQWFYLLQEW